MPDLLHRSPALVALGWVAYGLGYVAGAVGFFGSQPLLETLGTALVVAGLAAHAGAVVNDLRRRRAGQRGYVGLVNAAVVAALAVAVFA